MIVRNTLCKRTIAAYCTFLFTALLIWKHHEKSMKIEEDEDTLSKIISAISPKTVLSTSRVLDETDEQINTIASINSNRLDYWLQNNSRTIGINLTAILTPRQPKKYFVYVCHENCGGNKL